MTPEHNGKGGKEGAFPQDLMELFENGLPGAGMALEAGESQQVRAGGTASSFPFQHRALMGTDRMQKPQAAQSGGSFECSHLSKWADISNPAASMEHSTRPGSFPQAGWFTRKFPASVSVKPEWILNLYSPTHPYFLHVLLSPYSRAEGPGGCGSKALSALRH